MKRLCSILLTLLMIMTFVPLVSVSAEDTDVTRYTVLVLDTSNTSDFLDYDGNVMYTADTALPYVKTAAKKFIENLQDAPGDNYLAIVSYYGENSNVVSSFSKDRTTLENAIDRLSASSTVRSIANGLNTANNLLNSVDDASAVKNVVLFTTGMSNTGNYSYSGHYDDSVVGSNWHRSDTGIHLYAYSNSAYEVAETIKSNANLYTIGLFQTMSDMPEIGQEIVEFFKLFTKECATSVNHFYDVKNPEELEFIFGEVAQNLNDSDGDGLPDDWESNGVTVDGTFVDLPAMGADPTVPDVFVEVDWMVQPAEHFLWFETSAETSLAPSQSAMRKVYDVFKDHGIRLHIDAGPSSTDFVTGKNWGSRSGGNEITYEENFNLGNNYEHWNSTVEQNFSSSRTGIFKHCIFANRYNGTSSSGIANNIPGQFFIVANQKWLRKTGDTGIAGTFMHEMGHTLGLCHGGHTDSGDGNHTHYKPNYLSIMNYLFQTSGLVGTNAVNYSDYDLPDLDENSLDENAGIDPNGQTSGTNLGSKFKRNGLFGKSEYTVQPVSEQPVDFSGWWGIDKDRVDVDINADGRKEVLTSSNDWDHINFKGGNLGREYAYIAGLEGPGEDFEETLQEPQLDELIEAGVVGNKGAGAAECIGPVTALAGAGGQKYYIRVSNLSAEETTFVLKVAGNQAVKGLTESVTIPASLDKIEYSDVPVALVDTPAAGEYEIHAVLSAQDRDDLEYTYPLTVYAPTQKEKERLVDGLVDGELDDLLPDKVIDDLQDLLNIDSGFEDVKNSDYFDNPVLWAVKNKITEGTSENLFSPFKDCTRAEAVTFLWRVSGKEKVTGVQNPFKDVKSGSYYYDAVQWAVKNGITKGLTDDTFGPGDKCERGQIVTFLWRMKGMPAASATVSFEDVKDSAYYYPAVQWAVENGVTKGTSDTKFSPAEKCTRGQIVTFLYRARKIQ